MPNHKEVHEMLKFLIKCWNRKGIVESPGPTSHFAYEGSEVQGSVESVIQVSSLTVLSTFTNCLCGFISMADSWGKKTRI